MYPDCYCYLNISHRYTPSFDRTAQGSNLLYSSVRTSLHYPLREERCTS